MTMPEDGRNRRVVRTRAAVIGACREAMLAGVFRPSMKDVCAAAGVSIRSGFSHFESVEGLWGATLALEFETHTAIFTAIWGEDPHVAFAARDRIVRAAVFGRVT